MPKLPNLWPLRRRIALWLIGDRPLLANVIIYGFAAGRKGPHALEQANVRYIHTKAMNNGRVKT